MFRAFLVLLMALLSACTENLPLLSEAELEKLQSLEDAAERTKQKVALYDAELERISRVTASYITEGIELEDFSIYKSDGFEDGLVRGCYKGS